MSIRGLRILAASGLLLAGMVLSGCNSTVGARCETKINPGGSGTRTLTFTISRADAKSDNVDMKSVTAKVAAATPTFATFKDQSTASIYKYVISFDFKNSADLDEKASWFGGSIVTLKRSGGVFAPTIELDENFKPSNWFDWAVKAAGRSGSDLKSIEYVVSMPASVVDDSEESDKGIVDGNTFIKSGLSDSGEYKFLLTTQHSYEVTSLAVKTTVRPDESAERTVQFELPAEVATELEQDNGGADALKGALQSWAGDGWTAKSDASTTGVSLAITKTSKSIGGLGVGGSEGGATLKTLGEPNRYLIRRRFTEQVGSDVWLPQVVRPSSVSYQLQVPWSVESLEPEDSTKQQQDRTVVWSGAAGDRATLVVNAVEVRTDVLYPVLGILIGLVAVALVGTGIALARILTANPVKADR